MTSKKQPSKHLPDISKPKQRAAIPAAEPQLVIPKRSIMISEPPNADIDDLPPEHVEPKLEPKIEAKPVQPKPAAADAAPAAPTKAEAVQPPTPAEPATPVPEPERTKAPEAAVPEATPDKSADEPEITDDANEAGGDGEKADKDSANVRKALEQARREQEIQKHIDERDFFVPINAAARKRSVKVSLGLVLVELLLGLLLLNLMLDAGIIELLDRIPHTNFFQVNP